MSTSGVSSVGGAVSLLSSMVESGVVIKEQVEGVVPEGGVADEGVEEVMLGGRLEVESGSTGV